MLRTSGQAHPIRLSLHDSIHMIHREDWTHVAEGASLYLQYDHLRALEDVLSASMRFRYAIYYDEHNHPIGIAYFQVVELVDNGSDYREKVCSLAGLGSRIIRDMKALCLVSGNAFHFGDHGAYFKPHIPASYRWSAVEATLRKLDKGGMVEPRPAILLFKDFISEQYSAAQHLVDERYHALDMDANMVLHLDPDWSDMEDYQEALTSKARTRIRSLLKRSAALEVLPMNAKDIRAATPRLQGLFDQVLERSPFVFGRLKTEVYADWKMQLGEQLQFRGFFLNGTLVGFTAAFVVGDTLDVQYVGLDYAHNEGHALYQRMLFELLDTALRGGMRGINFGRTAEQAKSNLGAVPVPTRFYVKHRNTLASKLAGPFLRSIKPAEFEQRSPFKQKKAQVAA
ncbi:MAG: GNAT family N-acetyltransferase [Flavobacteriales bacterium]